MFEDVTRLHGLFAATFTPMDERGASRFAAVPDYVAHLRRQQNAGLYVAGGTGEGPSLTTDERRAVTEAFVAEGVA